MADVAHMSGEQLLKQLEETILRWNVSQSQSKVQEILNSGMKASSVLDAVVDALNIAGDLLALGKYSQSDFDSVTKAVEAALETLEPSLGKEQTQIVGRILIGPYRGNVTRLGGRIVSGMFKSAGFNVSNLDADAPLEEAMDKIAKTAPDAILLPCASQDDCSYVAEFVRELESRGIRRTLKVIVEGPSASEEFCRQHHLDGYGKDATTAVEKTIELMIKAKTR